MEERGGESSEGGTGESSRSMIWVEGFGGAKLDRLNEPVGTVVDGCGDGCGQTGSPRGLNDSCVGALKNAVINAVPNIGISITATY